MCHVVVLCDSWGVCDCVCVCVCVCVWLPVLVFMSCVLTSRGEAPTPHVWGAFVPA